MTALFVLFGFSLCLLANYMDHRLGRCPHTMWTCFGSWAATVIATALFGLIGALIS